MFKEDYKLRLLLIYALVKVVIASVSWLALSSTRKNIVKHIAMLKRKPSSSKHPRTMELTIREKLIKIIPPCMLIPGIGEIFLIAITLGRFSNKTKITKVYLRAIQKTEDNNLYDALNMMSEASRAIYKSLKRDAGFLSVKGHSEIAHQSILALNNLMVDANISGIDLKKEPSIKEALNNTAGLVSELLREEQSGVQSNIDTYLNVIESIKGDLIEKKSVFIDTTLPMKNNPKCN